MDTTAIGVVTTNELVKANIQTFFQVILPTLTRDREAVIYLKDENYHSPLGPWFNVNREYVGQNLMRIRSHKELFAVLEEYGQVIQHFTPFTSLASASRTKGHTQKFFRNRNVLVFDFERVHDDGSMLAPQEVMDYFIERLGMIPAFIVVSRSGKHYHVYVLHDRINSKKGEKLWGFVLKTFIRVIGSDIGAVGLTHDFAVPWRDIWYCTAAPTYELRTLGEIAKTHTENKYTKVKRRPKVRSFLSDQIWSHPAVKALTEATFTFDDAHDPAQSRNHAAFTIALIYYYLAKITGEDLDDAKLECQQFLTDDWFSRVRHVFKETGEFSTLEIGYTVDSAFSGKYSGPSPEWIERLTGIQFDFELYPSSYLRKPKSEGGRNNEKENRYGICNFLKEVGGTYHGPLKDFVAQLNLEGIASRTVHRLMPKLREEGLITYTSKRGQKKGSTIVLTDAGYDSIKLKSVNRASLALEPFEYEEFTVGPDFAAYFESLSTDVSVIVESATKFASNNNADKNANKNKVIKKEIVVSEWIDEDIEFWSTF